MRAACGTSRPYRGGCTKVMPPNERTIAVVGKGRAGVLGAYAALNETSIAEAVVVDPPASHREGPQFLGVMKVLDIPDALGLLAPKHLTLVGANDAAFDRTVAAFKAAGHAGRVLRQ